MRLLLPLLLMSSILVSCNKGSSSSSDKRDVSISYLMVFPLDHGKAWAVYSDDTVKELTLSEYYGLGSYDKILRYPDAPGKTYQQLRDDLNSIHPVTNRCFDQANEIDGFISIYC